MCEQCSKKTSKFFLIAINVIFMLAGLLMLGFSIAAFVSPSKVLSIIFKSTVDDVGLNELMKAIGVFGIVLGSVVVIVAFFGFVGAMCSNVCLLAMYLVLIILILLAQIALVITAALLDFNSIPAGRATLKAPMDNFTSDINIVNGIYISSKNPWTEIQLSQKCCGLRSHEEYNIATYKYIHYDGKNISSVVPLSCCVTTFFNETSFIVNDIKNCTAGIHSINPPCLDTLQKMVKEANKIILGVAAGIVGVELLVILLTSVLIHNLRREKNGIV